VAVQFHLKVRCVVRVRVRVPSFPGSRGKGPSFSVPSPPPPQSPKVLDKDKREEHRSLFPIFQLLRRAVETYQNHTHETLQQSTLPPATWYLISLPGRKDEKNPIPNNQPFPDLTLPFGVPPVGQAIKHRRKG
jgi:hypothetical protein